MNNKYQKNFKNYAEDNYNNISNILSNISKKNPIFKYTKINKIKIKKLLNFNDIYEYIKIIGHGGSGVVKCYKNTCTDELFAMKEISIINYEEIDSLMKEVEIFKEISTKIKNNNIVKYIDYFFRETELGLTLIIVSEYINGYSLQDYLNNMIDNDIFLSEKTLLEISYWLFDTLSILHYHGYVHRDIKPNNIMVDVKNNRFVLIDFGLSCSLNKKSKYLFCKDNYFDGTIIFMSPETLSNEKYLNPSAKSFNKLDLLKKADIWAAGITLYFIIEHKTPWSSKFNHDIILEITDVSDINYIFSLFIKDVLELALNKNPSQRLNAEYIKDFISYKYSLKTKY